MKGRNTNSKSLLRVGFETAAHQAESAETEATSLNTIIRDFK
jgi:hypothetical protein